MDLPCSGDHPPNPKWYALEGTHWTDVSVNGTGVKYKISDGTPPTLSVMDLNKDDNKFYCCKHNPERCQEDGIELIVTGKRDDSDQV